MTELLALYNPGAIGTGLVILGLAGTPLVLLLRAVFGRKRGGYTPPRIEGMEIPPGDCSGDGLCGVSQRTQDAYNRGTWQQRQARINEEMASRATGRSTGRQLDWDSVKSASMPVTRGTRSSRDGTGVPLDWEIPNAIPISPHVGPNAPIEVDVGKRVNR